jgi:hypothetical protein
LPRLWGGVYAYIEELVQDYTRHIAPRFDFTDECAFLRSLPEPYSYHGDLAQDAGLSWRHKPSQGKRREHQADLKVAVRRLTGFGGTSDGLAGRRPDVIGRILLGHVILHGGLGCAAMEVMGGRCASGFFAGASQSVLAGSNLTDAQKLALAPLVGGFAGFRWAEGQAVGVSFGSTVALSGLVNNYLTHVQVLQMESEMTQCLLRADCGDEEMRAIIERYRGFSAANRASLQA